VVRTELLEGLDGAEVADEDDEFEGMALQLASAFGVRGASRKLSAKSVTSTVVGTVLGADVNSHFRKRRLSKDLSKMGSNALLFGVEGDDDEAAPKKLSKQELMAATAARAATRAEKAAGKSMLVAREMDADYENESFRQSDDPKKRALAVLTDGGVVGTFSCHGVEPAPDGSGANAKINQDCACIAHPINGDSQAALFCVFDGHGEHGTEVSTQVLQSIRHALTEEEGKNVMEFGEKASAAAAFGAGVGG